MECYFGTSCLDSSVSVVLVVVICRQTHPPPFFHHSPPSRSQLVPTPHTRQPITGTVMRSEKCGPRRAGLIYPCCYVWNNTGVDAIKTACCTLTHPQSWWKMPAGVVAATSGRLMKIIKRSYRSSGCLQETKRWRDHWCNRTWEMTSRIQGENRHQLVCMRA